MSYDRKSFMMAMAAAMIGMDNPGIHGPYVEPKESPEERDHRLNQAEIRRNLERGLKEYIYGQNSLWALNQKSADKKARKRNWI